MNAWDEWKQKNEAKAPIFVMHRVSGGQCAKKRCKNCKYLEGVRHKVFERKGSAIFYTTFHCARYPGVGRPEWNGDYPACLMIEEK